MYGLIYIYIYIYIYIPGSFFYMVWRPNAYKKNAYKKHIYYNITQNLTPDGSNFDHRWIQFSPPMDQNSQGGSSIIQSVWEAGGKFD